MAETEKSCEDVEDELSQEEPRGLRMKLKSQHLRAEQHVRTGGDSEGSRDTSMFCLLRPSGVLVV